MCVLLCAYFYVLGTAQNNSYILRSDFALIYWSKNSQGVLATNLMSDIHNLCYILYVTVMGNNNELKIEKQKL